LSLFQRVLHSFPTRRSSDLSGKYWFEVNVSFPPTEVPQRPLLIEYFAFSAFTSTPCLCKYSISASRDSFKSRIGVITSTFGTKIDRKSTRLKLQSRENLVCR